MPVRPLYLAETLIGGLLVFTAVKNYTIPSVIENLLKGEIGGTVNTSTALTSADAASTAPASASPSTGNATGAAAIMLRYMEAQVGKPYSEDTSTNPATGEEMRFGPSEFDCSGLVYAASHQPGTGIALPSSQAIASSEADWFAALKGSKVIRSASSCVTGDILFFTGASPDPSSYGPIGHVGMCSSPGTLCSAYDTAKGVCYTPMAQDNFVVGVRLS